MDALCKVVLGLAFGKKTVGDLVDSIGLQEKEITDALRTLEREEIVSIDKESGNIVLKADLKKVLQLLENGHDDVTVMELNIPFKAKLGVGNASRYIVLPMYLIRNVNPTEGSIAVLKIGDVTISGSIGKRKNLFYIHKKYWGELGLEEMTEGKEIDAVLEKVVKPNK